METDIRPDLPLDEVDALIERYHSPLWAFNLIEREKENSNTYRVLHHLERYWFVRDYLEKYEMQDGHRCIRPENESDLLGPAPYGACLIDCGCGRGLGLRELAKANLNLLLAGIESDTATCKELPEVVGDFQFYNENIETCKPRYPALSDFIICFEVLGFTTLSSDEALLRKLDSFCMRQGVIFLSTPNYRDRSKKKYFNRIYNPQTFAELVTKNLPGYRMGFYGQLYPTNRKIGFRDLGVQPLEQLSAEPDFLIAVAKKNDSIIQAEVQQETDI